MTHGEFLCDELHHAVSGDAWHGPALQELLEGMSPDEAKQHPIPVAHSIWELVLHITSWATIAQRRIEGGQPEPFEGEDWPEEHEFSSERWDAARNALSESYDLLGETVRTMSDEALSKNSPKSTRSIAAMVSGVAQHASYHGGQIAILKKLVSTLHRRTAL